MRPWCSATADGMFESVVGVVCGIYFSLLVAVARVRSCGMGMYICADYVGTALISSFFSFCVCCVALLLSVCSYFFSFFPCRVSLSVCVGVFLWQSPSAYCWHADHIEQMSYRAVCVTDGISLAVTLFHGKGLIDVLVFLSSLRSSVSLRICSSNAAVL